MIITERGREEVYLRSGYQVGRCQEKKMTRTPAPLYKSTEKNDMEDKQKYNVGNCVK